jgi:hypothetical protein
MTPKEILLILMLCIGLLLYLLSDEISAATYNELLEVSWNINKQYSDVPNNCFIVALEKQKQLGLGDIKCASLPEKYLPTKLHCFLVVDNFILDNGFMKNTQSIMPDYLAGKTIL